MTLGGLALAVGILVDEATVAIENIHTHLARGDADRPRASSTRAAKSSCRGCWRCCAVVAVFVPSFFMTGVSRSLFVPLSLAVGFAMIASFLLSSSLVPVLSVWLLASAASHRQMTHAWVDRLRTRLSRMLERLAPMRASARRWRMLVVTVAVVGLVGARSAARSSRLGDALSSSSASALRPARCSRRRNGSRATCSTRSRPRPVRRMSRSRSVTSASSRPRIRSTRSSCGPADRTKACCRWRSRRTRRVDLADFEETLRHRFADEVSGRAVLLRARRHRQPHHELRRADAGASGDHRPRLRGDARVRRDSARRAAHGFHRSATCRSSRRSIIRPST